MRVFEYKLRPNKAQVEELERLLLETKCFYNICLEQLVSHYKETGEHLTLYSQEKLWSHGKCPQFSKAIRESVLKRVHRSFQNFFRGLKQDKKIGFPRFQSYKRWHSFEVGAEDMGRIVDGYWRLSRTCWIKCIQHRPLQGVFKMSRLVKRADGYYVQAVCLIENQMEQNLNLNLNKIVSVDMGLRYFIADSTGQKIKAPQYFRKSEKKLAVQQRALSKKKRGGVNRNKAREIVAKTHLKIARQRKDFTHKLSRIYADKYDYVCLENLNIKGMVKNRHLSKSISDAAWYQFQTLLSYKLKTLGKRLILVNPAYTSQICSQCGEIVKKSLSVRTHYCANCLFVEDRDVNASLNIKSLGLKQAIRESTAIAGSMN